MRKRTKFRSVICQWALVVGCMAVFITGCGPKPFPNSVRVSGKVTLDGRPLEFGSVRFAPDGAGQVAVGSIKNGAFTMRTTANTTGVAKGRYKVSIVCAVPEELPEGAPPVDPANPPEVKYKSLIPDRYANLATSGFAVEVNEPIRDLSFELTTP